LSCGAAPLVESPGKLEIENNGSVVDFPAPEYLIAGWRANALLVVKYSGSHPLPKFFDTP
jgi:hypothetical protein